MHNLYKYDRIARFGLALFLLYFSNIEFNMYSLMALILLATVFSGFCPFYRIFHINMEYFKTNNFINLLPKNNPEPVFVFTKTGKIVFQNKSSKEILPELKSFKALSQENPEDIISEEKKIDIRYKYKNKIYMIEIEGKKEESYIFSYGFNITQIENSKLELIHQNITDSLTKLGNRNKLLQDIENNENDGLCLFVFDISKFSQINGFYGHKKGDEFLQQFSNELNNFKKTLKFSSSTYRLRGNTFALLVNFENCQNEEKLSLLNEVLEKLFEVFKNFRISVNGIDTSIEVKVGIASKCEIKDDEIICLSLLNNAETALSEAKEKSLSFLFFRDIKNIHERYKNNLNWASKLHDIFDYKSDAVIKAYYQPIYNLKTQKIEKFEALVRIEEKDNVISPFKFLDIAKQINFLPKITKEVFSQSLKTFKDTNYEFSLNLTTQDLKDKNLLKWLEKKLVENGFKTSSIVLEILEDEDIYEYTNTIFELKEKGFKIAIDDFGTGYSNFKKLQLLNVDYIKIDGSLVKNIVTNPKDLSIINSICTYAKAIGVKTIAEFVADKEIFDLIKTTNVDYVQGYYIAEPNPNIEINFNDK